MFGWMCEWGWVGSRNIGLGVANPCGKWLRRIIYVPGCSEIILVGIHSVGVVKWLNWRVLTGNIRVYFGGMSDWVWGQMTV